MGFSLLWLSYWVLRESLLSAPPVVSSLPLTQIRSRTVGNPPHLQPHPQSSLLLSLSLPLHPPSPPSPSPSPSPYLSSFPSPSPLPLPLSPSPSPLSLSSLSLSLSSPLLPLPLPLSPLQCLCSFSSPAKSKDPGSVWTFTHPRIAQTCKISKISLSDPALTARELLRKS